MRILLAAVFAIALGGCALLSTPEKISATPAGGGLPIAITSPTIVADLQSAAFNLDQAVAVGALPAADPAPKCLHDILVKAGIEVPIGAEPAKSFTPKNDGAASAGAIAYILAQQLKASKPLTVDVSCEALLGRVVLDGVSATKRVVPLIGSLR